MQVLRGPWFSPAPFSWGRGLGGFYDFADYKIEYKGLALKNVVALLVLLMLGLMFQEAPPETYSSSVKAILPFAFNREA